MPRTKIINANTDKVAEEIKLHQDSPDDSVEVEFITGRGKDFCQVIGFIDTSLVKLIFEMSPEGLRFYGDDEDKTSKVVAEIPKDKLEYYKYDSQEENIRVCLRTKKLVSVAKSIAGEVILHFSIKKGDRSSLYFTSRDVSTMFTAIDELKTMEMPVDVDDDGNMADCTINAYLEINSDVLIRQLAKLSTESATFIVKSTELYIESQDGNDKKLIFGSDKSSINFIKKNKKGKVHFTFTVKKMIQLLKGLSSTKSKSDITIRFVEKKPMTVEYTIAGMSSVKIFVADGTPAPVEKRE